MGLLSYNKDASTVSASEASEVKTLRNNFLIKKLGLKDTPELNTAINEVLDVYHLRLEREKMGSQSYLQ